jgi:hypothetical protein
MAISEETAGSIGTGKASKAVGGRARSRRSAAQEVGLRPRTAYRQAHFWDLDEAAERYNAELRLISPDLPEITAPELGAIEIWPHARGEKPTPVTLTLLAKIYQTDVRNLLDSRDYAELAALDLLVLDPNSAAGGGGGQSQPKSSVMESLVGQATAGIAVLAAMVYAAGGLTLGLKLWFFRLSWTPVLGQLPHDFLLVTAVGQVILPVVAAGAAIGFGIHKLFGSGRKWYLTSAWYWFGLSALIGSAVAGLIVGLAPLAVLHFTSESAHNVGPPVTHLLQTDGRIYLFTAASSTATVFITACLLRSVYGARDLRSPVRLVLAMAVTAFALIPSVAAGSAAYLLPPVVLCAPNFLHPVDGNPTAGAMRGNLIGNNSQWAYIAQFTINAQNVVTARTITAVPMSSIRLEGIGQGSGCGDLTPTTR